MADVYRIGVSIALANGVSPVLGVIGRDLLGVNAQVGEVEKGLSRWKLAIGGAVAMMAGIGIVSAFKPALDQAKQLQQQVANFQLYNLGDRANAEAVRFAKAMEVMGSSYVDNMKLMNEAQGISRAPTLQFSELAVPILAKLQFIESGLSPDAKASRQAQDLAMLRFVEARGGANDPQTFATVADWGYRLQASSGHVVNWAGLQQLAATSGAAGFNLTPEAYAKLEPVIADLKGGKVGSGMRVAFSRLMGIQRGLPKQAISEYLSLGLWDPRKVELSAQGSVKRFTGAPGSVLRDSALFATDPVGYYVKDFLPAILKKYGPSILGDSVKARVERAAEITNVFGPGTAGAFFSQIDKQMPAILRSIAAQQRQAGIDQAYNVVGGTLTGKEIELHRRWKDLLEQTGEVVLPLAIKGLELILPPLKAISDFATNHSRAFNTIVEGVLALGSALVVGGAIALGAAAIAGVVGMGSAAVIATGIGAVVGALGTLVAFNWDGLKNAAASILHWPKSPPAVPAHPPGQAPPKLGATPAKPSHVLTHPAVTPAAAKDVAFDAWAAQRRAEMNAKMAWVVNSAKADVAQVGNVGGDIASYWGGQAKGFFDPVVRVIWSAFKTAWLEQLADWKAGWHALTGVGIGPGILADENWKPAHPFPVTPEQFGAALRAGAMLEGLLPPSAKNIQALAGAAANSNKALTGPGGLIAAAKTSGAALTGPGGFTAQVNSAAAALKIASAQMAQAGRTTALPPPPTHTTTHVTNVNIDGRTAARAVNRHNVNLLTGAGGSHLRYDGNAVLASPSWASGQPS